MCSRPFIAKIFAEMYAMMFGCGGTFSLKKSTAHFWSWGNNLGRVESLFEEMVKRRST